MTETHTSKGDGSYWAPHDEQALKLDNYACVKPGLSSFTTAATEALTCLRHLLYLLMMNDELFLAPLEDPKRVIDVGTGIGIWAQYEILCNIDFQRVTNGANKVDQKLCRPLSGCRSHW